MSGRDLAGGGRIHDKSTGRHFAAAAAPPVGTSAAIGQIFNLKQLTMTMNSNSKSSGRGASVAGLGGLALMSVLLLCGAGNAPIENFTPQGAMQADLNAGGHSVTNAAAVNASSVTASTLNAGSATAGTLTATNLTVSGGLTATNFTLPFASVTGDPATLAGYGIGDAYTKTASDARYSPLAGSTNVTTLGAVTTGTFPYANVSGNPLTVAGGKTLGVGNTLTLAGTDGATLNVGAGGTLGSAAFANTTAFLAPAAVGTTVQPYNANTTTLGNTVNGASSLVQTDATGALVDSVLRAGARTIYVSKSLGNDTRTNLSKYSLVTPFASLTAAAAATAGDTIVAEDGVFTDHNLMLVSGVDWFFMPAATMTVTGAATNDTLFKDGGTAATVSIGGCGQTFSLGSTTASTSITCLYLTAASNVTLYGIGLSVSESATGGTATGISSSQGAVVNMTGNVTAQGGSAAASSYGIYLAAPSGATITVNGSVYAGGPISGYGMYATGTTTGTVTVTQRLAGGYAAVNNSSVTTVTCAQLGDGIGTSLANNHLMIYSPILVTQIMFSVTTGFNFTSADGPSDSIMLLNAAASMASGTINLPPDSVTRLGEKLTIVCAQTITALTVTVASGTIYGWSGGTFNAGSITFEKVGTNTWTKL
jgi:hypothetical protein